jgi:hydrogenase maturation protease
VKLGIHPYLFVGIGNILKGDDALGQRICEFFSHSHCVDTVVVQQLQTELLDSFLKRDCVIFADASIHLATPLLELVRTEGNKAPASSHQMDAKTLVQLFRKFYPEETTQFYTLGIPAFSFEIGADLTDQAKTALDAAKNLLETMRKSSF